MKTEVLESFLFDSLLLLFFVAQLQVLRQFLQALAVIQLDLAASAIELLELLYQRNLRLDSDVQASQLFIQLKSDV